MKKLMNLFFLLLGMVSCDTREDWFEKNSDGPDLIVDINGKIDTISQGELKKIFVNLKTVRNKKSLLYTDTVIVAIKGNSNYGQIPIPGANLYGVKITGGRTYYEGDDNDVYFKLYHVYDASEYILFQNDTTSFLLEDNLCEIQVYDQFGNEQYYTLEIDVHGPIPPTPVLEVKRLPYNMEYTLSQEKSFDRDGNVMKYEWCVDGNVVSYRVSDNRLENVKGVWQSGKAAYGGTYITATTLSSINHSFQTTGEHTVYYRCMDDMGVWSMWYSEKINVE